MRLVLMKTVRQSAALVSLLFFLLRDSTRNKRSAVCPLRASVHNTTTLSTKRQDQDVTWLASIRSSWRRTGFKPKRALVFDVFCSHWIDPKLHSEHVRQSSSTFWRLVFNPRRHAWRKRRFHREHDLVPEQFHISASFLFLCCRYFEEKTKEIQCPLNAI